MRTLLLSVWSLWVLIRFSTRRETIVNTSSRLWGSVSLEISPWSITRKFHPRIKRYLHCSLPHSNLCFQKKISFFFQYFIRPLIESRSNREIIEVYLEPSELRCSSKTWVCPQSQSCKFFYVINTNEFSNLR